MTTNEIREMIKAQRQAKVELDTKVKEIRGSEMYSESYKKLEIEKAIEAYKSESRARGSKVAGSLEKYKSEVYKPVDMSDATLTNFLTVLQTMGKDTPINLIMDTAEHFRGSQTTLDLIARMMEKTGCEGIGTVRGMILDTEVLNQAIIEASVGFEDVTPLGAIGVVTCMIDGVDSTETAHEPVSSGSIPALF